MHVRAIPFQWNGQMICSMYSLVFICDYDFNNFDTKSYPSLSQKLLPNSENTNKNWIEQNQKQPRCKYNLHVGSLQNTVDSGPQMAFVSRKCIQSVHFLRSIILEPQKIDQTIAFLYFDKHL